MTRRLGIHARLFLAAFFLIVVAMIIMVFLGVHTTTHFLSKRFEDRMDFLARYLALNSEVGVLLKDTKQLEKFSSNLLSEEDVVRVVIKDDKGHVLVDVGNRQDRELHVVTRKVLFKERRGGAILFSSKEIKEPPKVRVIGSVELYYTTQGIDRLAREMALRYMLSSLGVIALAGLFLFFISRSIVKEVTALAETARKVGSGDVRLRARPGTIPETRELALAFNTMLDSLSRKRKALVKANREMIRQRSLAELGKFSLIVAHEVKNPLGIIKSSLEILCADFSIPQDHPMVEYIDDEIKRLNRLIEDFLVFARPSEMKLGEADLNALAREAASRTLYESSGKELHVEQDIPDEPCMALVDAQLLTGAFWNVVKNACEATPDGGRIWIRAFVQDDTWVMEVTDSGDGIEPEMLSKIFEPFFTTKAKGSGLGLVFASQVIEAHGGTITASNRQDAGGDAVGEAGAVFTIRIPLRRQEDGSIGEE